MEAVFMCLLSFLVMLTNADSSSPYNIRCVVYDWQYMRCSFKSPENSTNLSLCYSPCYGCSSNAIYSCPNFINNSCTLRKSNGFRNDDRTYSMFVCDLTAAQDEKVKHPSRRDFKVNEIVKPGPVKVLKSGFISNTSVRISWKVPKKSLKCEITLKDSRSNQILQVNTTTENQFEFRNLKPRNQFNASVRCIPVEGGFWSDPDTIEFETKEEDLSGGLLKLLGFQVLSKERTKRTIRLHWQVLNRYVVIGQIIANISCTGGKKTKLLSSSIESHSKSFDEILDLRDCPCTFGLTGVTTNSLSSHSELTISLDEDLAQFPEPPLLLTNRTGGNAFLKWPHKEAVANVTVFFNNFTQPSVMAERENMAEENSSSVPPPLTIDGSATSLNSSSLIDHQLHISFQRMEVLGDRQVPVHGPMIPITCEYNLDEDVAPPSNLSYLKDSLPDSFAVSWSSHLDCGSRYFSHLLMEYYPTDCVTCSKEARKVRIPRFSSNWSVDGLEEGPYQLRMRAECNLTGKESSYTPYITVKVSAKEGEMKFIVPIALCSIVLLLVAGSFIGSRACSNLKSKLYIEVPDSACSSYPQAKEKQQYQLPLHKAKSFYKLFFSSQHTVSSSKASCLDKQDLFAWWNPNYRVYRKHSFGSTPCLTPEKQTPFQDREYMNWYYKETKVDDNLDVYSSVKVFNPNQLYV